MRDVLGLTLDEAEALLKSERFDYQVIETVPHGRQKPEGDHRVVRQTVTNDGRVLLVVARALKEPRLWAE